MKTGYLKCYYGSQNRGDELLFFGVIKYIFENYQIDKLDVEVGDIKFMNHRVNLNVDLFKPYKTKIKFVKKGRFGFNFSNKLKFFAGGEIFAESRGFHGGRNYFMKYFKDILTGNFIIMGGVETPSQWRQKLLYRIVLPRAKELVLREDISYKTCLSYNKHSKLHQDFALDVVTEILPLARSHRPPLEVDEDACILINLHPSIASPSSLLKIKDFISQYPEYKPVYMRCGKQDRKYLSDIQKFAPNTIQYDRTQHSVLDTVSLFAHAKAAIGARLHFLLMAKECNIPFQSIIYAEKVTKLIYPKNPQ